VSVPVNHRRTFGLRRARKDTVMPFGPIQYMVVGFPGNKFTGNISRALAALIASGQIRIIDLTFVTKDQDGNVAALELEDLDSDAAAAFSVLEALVGDLVNEDDIQTIAEELPPNTSAAVLVWEDVWARGFVEALEEADGVLIDIQRVPRDIAVAALEAAGVTP
jgi:uncharacterized membrane protein